MDYGLPDSNVRERKPKKDKVRKKRALSCGLANSNLVYGAFAIVSFSPLRSGKPLVNSIKVDPTSEKYKKRKQRPHEVVRPQMFLRVIRTGKPREKFLETTQ